MIPLLCVSPKESEPIRKGVCAPMLIVVLSATAEIQKQRKHPLTDTGIERRRYIYGMEYYSATKKKDLAICDNTDGPRGYYAT